MEKEEELIGGQAVIDGILLRKKDKIAIAVRKPDGKIKVIIKKTKSLTSKRLFGLPFIRGTIILIEMLIIGAKALSCSTFEKTNEKVNTLEIFASLMLALIFGLIIFKIVPFLLALVFAASSSIIFAVIEGIIKLLIILAYLILISKLRDIKEVFEYHGAEHKIVNCYESKKPLTLANINSCKKEHARCGTGFLFVVIAVSIILYAFIPITISLLEQYAWRLILLPLITGISYEAIRIGAKKHLAFLSAPGIWLQSLTTREPNKKQLQVAVKAMKALVKQ
ncbi:DUF1385 domain-containing protein [archaeon]|nr:DUF1385 domain-containing protein [archaeon]